MSCERPKYDAIALINRGLGHIVQELPSLKFVLFSVFSLKLRRPRPTLTRPFDLRQAGNKGFLAKWNTMLFSLYQRSYRRVGGGGIDV